MSRRRWVLIAAVACLFVAAGAAFSSDYVRAASSEALRTTPGAHDGRTLAALEPAVRDYVGAVDHEDADALVAAFHPDASVGDTGRRFHGHDAIRSWARDEVIGGELTVLGATPSAQGTTVLLRFDPDGLLAPFRAHYTFELRDGLIHRLSLSYA